ncbi:MAG TPA: RecX family transcriptional regulator [Gaiellaceae bacterium]
MPAEGAREVEVAVDHAVRALARRDHSAAALRAKLEHAGISPAAQAEAIAVLERCGYLDDARYARSRAARLAERGYGDDRIRADLSTQGIGREAIEPALSALEPEAERAALALAKAGGGRRALRALARRGYSEGSLESAAALVADDLPEGVGYESSI